MIINTQSKNQNPRSMRKGPKTNFVLLFTENTFGVDVMWNVPSSSLSEIMIVEIMVQAIISSLLSGTVEMGG